MTPEQAKFLQHCNGMGSALDCDKWVPMIKRGDRYYTPSGIQCEEPDEWRDMTHWEIVAEMDAGGWVPVVNFGVPLAH